MAAVGVAPGVRGVSKARLMRANSEKVMAFRAKFDELINDTLDAQCAFFMKSFIFALGENWKDVPNLASKFQKYLSDQNETKELDPVQAADFLQKNGRTRTAAQRKQELEDIDIDKNGKIVLILTEFFKRHEMAPNVDLSNDGIGLVGTGEMLLEELFTMPAGLDPEIEEAIAEFMKKKREKEEKITKLEATAAAGGVKGLAAKNEIAQMAAADTTEDNRIEITLKAKQRRASKYSAADQLAKKQDEEKQLVEKKRRDSRAALAAKAAAFSGGGGGGVVVPPSSIPKPSAPQAVSKPPPPPKPVSAAPVARPAPPPKREEAPAAAVARPAPPPKREEAPAAAVSRPPPPPKREEAPAAAVSRPPPPPKRDEAGRPPPPPKRSPAQAPPPEPVEEVEEQQQVVEEDAPVEEQVQEEEQQQEPIQEEQVAEEAGGGYVEETPAAQEESAPAVEEDEWQD